MAIRYSGNARIRVTYRDAGFYECRVYTPDARQYMWGGTVYPAASGFGPGIAYDSPRAYDEIARSALAFALSDQGDTYIKPEIETVDKCERFRVTRFTRSE